MAMAAYTQMSATFSALADPTRLAILHQLSQGESSVKELAKPFEMSMPAITKHLKVLENAGLISRTRQAQWRPCQIEPKGFSEVSEWIQSHQKLWEDRFDRLETYLNDLNLPSKKETGNAS